ncbi:glycosyltransferase family 2 protein [Cyclobacterium jeungdonense]|uniref:Glycosyltransferase family 2 protein n=1 Tax=Cyclobacterium jeungdonense TaxID=708087 RepID=A0ABT8CAM9_9BACT|nr:glycosyltransferase family 2 protein [Cyclobacterium jeungdonense]MDN3688863.1 glycosyltransferase family 2 protein [Cyclobacterium jeungdonense]
MVSVIVLTKNEENDLSTCLESLSWCDDIHVLDSGSTDKTLEMAQKYEVKTWHHPFESFGKQRNYALDRLPLRHEWVLFLDADEASTKAFQDAVYGAIQSAKPEMAGFYLCWKMILEGKWLKYCDNFPKWQLRLVRMGKVRYTDFGHGQKEGSVEGKIGYIKEPYLHFSFSKGWSQWIDRHNKYSTLEALSRYRNCPPFKSIFTKNKSLRNLALKSWLSKLHGWPLLRFFYAYFLNLGFLEGTQGYIYCVNMSYHEFLIQIKIREIKKGYKG